MGIMATVLRSALLGKLVRELTERWRARAAAAIVGAVLAAVCATLALVFGAWALFALLRESLSPAGAAGLVALLFLLLALSAIATLWLMRRHRRRHGGDVAQLLGAVAATDLPPLGAGTVVVGGLTLGLLVGLALNRPKR